MSWKIDDIVLDFPPRQVVVNVRREQESKAIFGQTEPLVLDYGIREHTMQWVDAYVTETNASALQSKAKDKAEVTITTPIGRFNGTWNLSTLTITDLPGMPDHKQVRIQFTKPLKIFVGKGEAI